MRSTQFISALLIFLVSSVVAAAGPRAPSGASTTATLPSPNAGPATSPLGGQAQGADVEALAFIVLMDAAKSAEDDLKSIMDGVKAINDAKQGWRATAEKLNDVAGEPCKSVTASAFRRCIQALQRKMNKMEVASLDLMRASVLGAQDDLSHLRDGLRQWPQETDRMRRKLPPPARTLPQNPCRGWNIGFWKDCVAALDARLAGNLPDDASANGVRRDVDALKQQIDSMSELGETESLRLQMAMDRLSKLMSTLSNILKKISQTQQTITQNLK